MFYSIRFSVSFIDPNTLGVFIKCLYSSSSFIPASEGCLCTTPAHDSLHSFRLSPSAQTGLGPRLASASVCDSRQVTTTVGVSRLCSGSG